MTTKTTSILACCVSMGLLAALAPAAHADGTSPHPGVGGHIGVATSFVQFSSSDAGTTTIGDQFSLGFPIGIGFPITEKLGIDFETIVGNPISSRGPVGFTVDPGLVYNTGQFVLGLRLGFDIGHDTNFKAIPLIHKAVADLGAGANFFVEAAFPITLDFHPDNLAGTAGGSDISLDLVLHVGVGF